MAKIWSWPHDEILVATEQQSGYSFAQDGGWAVAIDTTLTDELVLEGLARDFIRAVQNARKAAGFEVSDHIAILLRDSESDVVAELFEEWGETIQNETLADELRLVDADYPDMNDVTLGEETVGLRVEKL